MNWLNERMMQTLAECEACRPRVLRAPPPSPPSPPPPPPQATDFEIQRSEQRAETQNKYNAKRAMYREKYAGIQGVGTETLLDRDEA